MTDEVFERTAKAYGDTIFRVAYHALRSRPDAEDVTQSYHHRPRSGWRGGHDLYHESERGWR